MLEEGKAMVRIKVTIRDDEGGMSNKTAAREYELNVGKGTLTDASGESGGGYL